MRGGTIRACPVGRGRSARRAPRGKALRLALTGWISAASASCAAPQAPPPLAPAPVADVPAASDSTRIERFFRVEQEAIDWIAAADPRLAARGHAAAPEEVLKRIGTEAVLAEDAKADIRGGSLDLFAFQGRMRALSQAARVLDADRDPLPPTAPPDSPLVRPQLERDLLVRLIEEERARTVDEAQLVDASGDLVRGLMSTWTPPSAAPEWRERDLWVSEHLLEIRESLRDGHPPSGPLDLDAALYPLERLLAPLQFPRSAAAIAEVRLALDEPRVSSPLVDPTRIAALAKVHLGLPVDPTALNARFGRLEERLRALAQQALEKSSAPVEAAARAAKLLLVEAPCPAVSSTRVRAMSPPPERSVICGALRALNDATDADAALIALHDDVLLAYAGITTAPPPRTKLLSSADNEQIDALRKSARERPVRSLGVALAAELLYGSDGAERRLHAWLALGEAPLDVVAREIGATPSG